MSVSGDGNLEFAIFGTCDDRCPTAHRAEVWGILGVLRRARFPLVLACDCKAAVDMWKRGREFCCDGNRQAADLWRSIWDLLDKEAPGAGDFCLRWVKGHTSSGDIQRGTISARNHQVNVLADDFAKRGSALAVELCPNDDVVARYSQITAFYRQLVRLVGRWPQDYFQLRSKAAPSGLARAKGTMTVHALRPHEPWRGRGGAISCVCCSKSTKVSAGPALAAFVRSPCAASKGDGDDAVGLARRRDIERCRRGLVGRGYVPVVVVAGKAGLAKVPVGPPASGSKIWPCVVFADLRAENSPSFNLERVGLNISSGHLTIIGRRGQKISMLSGIRGGGLPSAVCQHTRSVAQGIFVAVFVTPAVAEQFTLYFNHTSSLPPPSIPHITHTLIECWDDGYKGAIGDALVEPAGAELPVGGDLRCDIEAEVDIFGHEAAGMDGVPSSDEEGGAATVERRQERRGLPGTPHYPPLPSLPSPPAPFLPISRQQRRGSRYREAGQRTHRQAV